MLRRSFCALCFALANVGISILMVSIVLDPDWGLSLAAHAALAILIGAVGYGATAPAAQSVPVPIHRGR